MAENGSYAPPEPEVPAKWVMVSSQLLAQLGDWSEPVRVRITEDQDGILEMEFERV